MSYPWETRSAASAPAGVAPVTTPVGIASELRARARALAARVRRPELLGVMALAGVLNLWALSRNGWANEYYAAAVKSMAGSWHDFLFASLDKGGVMTVDKPPLALWVQALSVRVFGFHSLSILVPQALEGVASVALVYDLVRRRFGRVGGFAAGLALALTPIAVAVSRHNNPDALLVLLCMAALWCTVRALESRGTRWLVAAGVCVGLAFETKMLVALVVVPGIVAAWLWTAPGARAGDGAPAAARAGRWARGRVRALGQLLLGGAAMLVVGGAWPLLVELTPASERPWISGTSDNRILSLIFEYNGVGRVDGQAGGPGGGGGTTFGGTPGPLRLLNEALGGQAGWLLGFALVAGLAILVSSRLRRADARTGWLVAVGGAFATAAVLFSAASGIFHPYYVSLLAPFVAALVGAGAAQLLHDGRSARVLAPAAVVAGVVVELVVRGDYAGQLTWLPAVLIVVGVPAAIALGAFADRRVRMAALGAALGALLLAPGVWAFDTLGHATSGTFPAGGPASIAAGGFGGPGGGFGSRGFGGPRGSAGRGAPAQLFGSGQAGGPPAGGFGRGGGAIGAPIGGGTSLTRYLSYVKQHGGGTIAVSSQSSAASAILTDDANVAGIGGFSGRESDVTMAWLAQEVRAGEIGWVLDEGASALGGGLHGDTRTGARTAMAAVAQACERVTLSSGTASSSSSEAGAASSEAGAASSEPGAASSESGGLYDCAGRAAALASVAARESSS
jgi:4-amino-4-deoxy-L-arabinose transferase-like glycosyltransferase